MKRAINLVVISLNVIYVGRSVAAAPYVPEALAPAEATVVRTDAPAEPPSEHATPRLKLSYVRFSIGNADGSAVPLQALHLDLYPLSRPWVRGGLELEAGRGQATLLSNQASLEYGLLGLSAGVQIPGRLTPFVEVHGAGGVLGAHTDATLTIPGTTVTLNGGSAATWIYEGGLNAGVEVYGVGRSYLSVSLGWIRTTWGNADYAAMLQNPSASIKFADVTHDSFLLKVGLGI